jgi:hypothetical protein
LSLICFTINGQNLKDKQGKRTGKWVIFNSKDLKIICTGNVWTDKHFDTMTKSGLFGFRTTSTHTLNNFIKFNLTKQKK